MTDIPEHLLWLHERYGARLSKALLERDGVALAPGAAIAAFGRADPTQGLKLTDWLVRIYVEEQSFRWEDIQSGQESTVGQALQLWITRRSRIAPELRDINLYASPGALWTAVGGDVEQTNVGGRALKRAERAQARDESLILIEDDRGTVVVPLTRFASCWWGRGTRWCTAADKDNAFASYDARSPLFVLVRPDGAKAQFHAHGIQISFMDSSDTEVQENILKTWNDLLDPVITQAIRWSGGVLRYGSEVLKRNKDVVVAAVKMDGMALEHANANLCSDRDVVSAAIRQEGRALQYAEIGLRADKEVVMEAVRQNGWALQHASTDLCADGEVAAVAIKQNGWLLQQVSVDLRANRELVLVAVAQQGLTLQYADPVLQDDRDVVLAAMTENIGALEYASPDLQADPQLRALVNRVPRRNRSWGPEELAERFRAAAAVESSPSP